MLKNNTLRNEFLRDRKGISLLNREIRVKEILKYKKSGKLLDVGCALGFFLMFAEKYFDTYGMDISYYAIEKAKKISKKTHFYVKNAQKKYPFENGFFDILVSFDVIEHLKKPEKSIKEAYRVLKRGGYFFIHTPTDKSQKIIPDKTHINLFSKKRLINLLKKEGFEIIKFERRRFILYPNKFFMNFVKKISKKEIYALDNYKYISNSSKFKKNNLRRLKIFLYHLDRFFSIFLPAPEMFIIVKKK